MSQAESPSSLAAVPGRIKSIPLRAAFENTFFERFDFKDFCEGALEPEYRSISYRGRDIYSPTPKYKRYLRFLNSYVFNFALANNEVVHSYRRRKNCLTALEPHAQSRYFFVSDIKGFFGAVSQEGIRAVLYDKTGSVPIRDMEAHRDRILQMVSVNGHLPIGFPTSPLITNSHLLEFDNALHEYCAKRRIRYTRYSDDLILSADAKERLAGIGDVVSGYLGEYAGAAFSLSPGKTRFLHRGRKISIIGLELLPNGRISVNCVKKSHVEVLLHFYVHDEGRKYRECLDKFFGGRASVVKGRINYLKFIDPDYVKKLKGKYGNFVVDYFCHSPRD